MGSREQMQQKDDEIEKEIDPNAPTIKICLRLPNGSKETITLVATDTIEVNIVLYIILFHHHHYHHHTYFYYYCYL